ncbi:MAG: diacylglycerol kinase [Phycisphaerales bacterium]|nr:diacylglycerol kinase [Phycisphaerales bacterium]
MKQLGSVAAIARAFLHSCAGLRAACSERAFMQELLVIAPLWVVAWLMPVTIPDSALLCGVLLLILIVELINSAIEANTDHISPQRHPLAKRAKDLGSAAVMLTIGLAAFVWGAVLWQRLFTAAQS